MKNIIGAKRVHALCLTVGVFWFTEPSRLRDELGVVQTGRGKAVTDMSSGSECPVRWFLASVKDSQVVQSADGHVWRARSTDVTFRRSTSHSCGCVRKLSCVMRYNMQGTGTTGGELDDPADRWVR